jgi:hypothetical protein
MKQRFSLILPLLLISVILLTSCKKDNHQSILYLSSTAQSQETYSENYEPAQDEDVSSEEILTYDWSSIGEIVNGEKKNGILAKTYKNQEINVKFPEFTNLNPAVNNIIKEAALSGLTYYNPQEDLPYLSLDIEYEIKLKDDKFVSIAFSGLSYYSGAAHPNNLFYTVNVDLNKQCRLKLTDVVGVNDSFIDKLKQVAKKQLVDYQLSAFEDYDKEMSSNLKQTLVIKMDTIDIYNNSYSYITKDKIGIVLETFHAYGDYMEIEISKADLNGLLNI